MQKQRRGTMRDPFRVDRMEKAQIVDVPVDFRKQVARPAAALAMLAKLPQRLHHPLRRTAPAGVGNNPRVVEGNVLPVALVEQRLVVIRIDVAHAALHEQKDHPFRPRRKMDRLRSERIG